MVEYGLGVDLGTTYTAAAINVGGEIETVRLGGRGPEMPSVVFLRADGEVLVGDAAQRRGEGEATRLAREFKRRLGDPVPIMLGGTPMSAHAITARLLRHVVATVAGGQGGPPARIVLTHPANWGPYKRELLMQAAQLADLPQTTLRTEPEAAAVRYAGTARVAVGETIAVYDLGGGTFDAAVLRKTADGFEIRGEPQGVEQLGGIDFDEAILEYVREQLGPALAGMDLADPAVTEALTRLRCDCVEAKESLSFDTEAEIGVALPRLHTRVRLHRSEFEAMIAPALADTVAAVERALRSAGADPSDLSCIVLAGGSSRIPLVGSLVSEAFGCPVAADEQPELGIALGAARLSGPAGSLREPATPAAPTPPRIAGSHRPPAPAGHIPIPPGRTATQGSRAAAAAAGGPPAAAAPPARVSGSAHVPAHDSDAASSGAFPHQRAAPPPGGPISAPPGGDSFGSASGAASVQAGSNPSAFPGGDSSAPPAGGAFGTPGGAAGHSGGVSPGSHGGVSSVPLGGASFGTPGGAAGHSGGVSPGSHGGVSSVPPGGASFGTPGGAAGHSGGVPSGSHRGASAAPPGSSSFASPGGSGPVPVGGVSFGSAASAPAQGGAPCAAPGSVSAAPPAGAAQAAPAGAAGHSAGGLRPGAGVAAVGAWPPEAAPMNASPVDTAAGAWGAGGGRKRSVKWPIIGGFAAVLVIVAAVTAIAVWPKGGDAPAGAGEPGGGGSAAVAGVPVVWKAATGVGAGEPPAVGAELVFVSGQDGTLRAYRRSDGGKAWELHLGDGLRASTRVVGGVVYAVTGDGGVYAVDGAKGTELWHRNTGNPVVARPFADAERVFVGGKDGVLYAYKYAEGHGRWRVWAAEISYPPTVIGDVVVVAGSDGRLFGASSGGAELWKAQVGVASGGPVPAGDAACVALEAGTARCVRVADGRVLAEIRAEGTTLTRIYASDGVVFGAGADGSVGAWDAVTGERRWLVPGAGGAGFPLVRAGEVDVTFPDGRIAGLDAATGKTLWESRTGDHFSAAVRGDEAGLYAVGEGGVLYALRPPGSSTALPSPTVTTATATPTPTAGQETKKPTTRPTRRRPTSAPVTYEPTSPPPPTKPTSTPQGTEPTSNGNDNNGNNNGNDTD
ncbi:Hsp70 family protein [Actinoplanes sp. NPDC026619]|uniref:Hsp70 family protein n=1 Tax=Actinoplanes sp. NPDC026619 TaxID=3155798 RepID=UPI0033F6DE6A